MSIRNTETNRHFLSDGMNRKQTRMFAIIVIVIIVALSALYLRFTWNRYQDIASSEAIMLAQSLETLFQPEEIAKLFGSDADLVKPEYIMTKSRLMQLVKTTNPIHFAYLVGERDGSIVILLDSESPDSPDYSPPGQVYEEADDSYREIFKTGKTILTGSITDRWGTWISALVPIKNPADGKVIAAFGTDYAAAEWYADLWKQMIPDAIIVFCLMMLFFALLRSRAQQLKLKALSEKLAFDENLYHSVFDQAPIGIAIVNDKSFVIQSEFRPMNMNPMFERILGRTSRDLENIKWTEITHPEDLPADLEKFEQFKNGEINGYSLEKRFLKPNGSSLWTNMKVSHFLGSYDQHSMHLCLLEDISTRKEIEKSLLESERSKSVLVANLPGMAYRSKYDRNWTMLFVSAGCFQLTGYHPESLIYNKNLSYNDLITPEYREPLWKEWERLLAQRLPFQYEYEITTANGERKWVLELAEGIFTENGEVEALEGIILDISNRKEMENNLRYHNEHDSWTGLYNRAYLEDLLRSDAKNPKKEKRAVVGINLSAVHQLSMIYGFNYGQELIKKAIEALTLLSTDQRQLFNTYVNRFLFYVKAYEDKNELVAFCNEVINILESVFAVERISGGIGIIEIDEDNEQDIERVLKNLLIASEKAIAAVDRDFGFCFYDTDMESQIIREETIHHELVQIAAGENDNRLYLQFQPILDLKLNQICGFEALVRLNSTNLGTVPPLEFIAIAEKTKLSTPLGKNIIRQAFHFLNRLKENGYDTISVSINISAIQLLRNDFVENLFDMIREMQVNP
ncbi:MAG TPA: PAS domain S-box protein, partial [Bacillota bacterium]|nr:PAS domain S-box protein [Bacillota bacterium]